MDNITYIEQIDGVIIVKLGRKTVGKIIIVEGNKFIYVPRSKISEISNPFESLAKLKASLEGKEDC